jgi:hypothetical protein
MQRSLSQQPASRRADALKDLRAQQRAQENFQPPLKIPCDFPDDLGLNFRA